MTDEGPGRPVLSEVITDDSGWLGIPRQHWGPIFFLSVFGLIAVAIGALPLLPGNDAWFGSWFSLVFGTLFVGLAVVAAVVGRVAGGQDQRIAGAGVTPMSGGRTIPWDAVTTIWVARGGAAKQLLIARLSVDPHHPALADDKIAEVQRRMRPQHRRAGPTHYLGVLRSDAPPEDQLRASSTWSGGKLQLGDGRPAPPQPVYRRSPLLRAILSILGSTGRPEQSQPDHEA